MFKITGGKGFHVTFASGWTVSVQFGPGNYGDNYSRDFGSAMKCGEDGSIYAEVWCWSATKNWPENPLGYQSSAQVLAIMNAAAIGDFSSMPQE